MKNLINLILVLIMISTISCQKTQEYIITGDLTGFPDSTTIYLRNLSTDETFDSTMVMGNKFQLKGQLQDVPEQIWLNARIGNEFIYTNLLIGNENIKIKADVKDFPYNVSITGSKTQDDFNYLRDLTKSYGIRRDSLIKSLYTSSPEEQKEKGRKVWDEIRTIDHATHSIYEGYVKSHTNTYPGLIYLGYLQYSLPKDTVRALFNKLSDELKASKYATVIEVFLGEKISEVGDTFHDFEAFNKNGDAVKFSDLIGKYILLDFTAAYCGPCVESADELRLIDRTYSDSLEIVSFSGDPQKDVWLNSLKRDSVSWVSLWDGKGRYSKTCIRYGVNAFPSFFLIDPKGKIIDMWSGYGKGLLEDKLNRFKIN